MDIEIEELRKTLKDKWTIIKLTMESVTFTMGLGMETVNIPNKDLSSVLKTTICSIVTLEEKHKELFLKEKVGGETTHTAESAALCSCSNTLDILKLHLYQTELILNNLTLMGNNSVEN